MAKDHLFSLSKDNKDFEVQPFKGSGKGGQKRNKTMSACRIIHKESGVVSECQEERSFEQNKKRAFERLIQNKKFKKWLDIEKARHLGLLSDIEKSVEEQLKDVKIEVREDGKWTTDGTGSL